MAITQSVRYNKQELQLPKVVFYTGTDALNAGSAVCFDVDRGTAADKDLSRGNRVEAPSATNLEHFAGLTSQYYPANSSGQWIVVYQPGSMGVNAYAYASCTIDSTVLCVVPGQQYLQGYGTGLPVALAVQTVDRSSTAGAVQVHMFPNTLTKADRPYDSATGAGPSPAVWASCPWLEMLANPGLGYTFFDDFMAPMVFADATAQGGYCTKQDTGVTIQALETNDEVGGVIEIANNDADNDFGHLFVGDGVSTCGFNIAASSFKPFWFESRLKVARIADDSLGLFVGLGEVGLIADAALTDDTGEVADENFIGAQILCADGNALVPCYKADGQTKQSGTGAAITADTYFKVGLAGDGTTIGMYINGALDTTLTAANIAAATFPSATNLIPMLLTIVGTNANETAIQMDWWRAAQLR